MTPKNKRVAHSNHQKYEIIASLLNKTKTRKAIQIELGVSASTLSEWVKNKDKIISDYNLQYTNKETMRVRFKIF